MKKTKIYRGGAKPTPPKKKFFGKFFSRFSLKKKSGKATITDTGTTSSSNTKTNKKGTTDISKKAPTVPTPNSTVPKPTKGTKTTKDPKTKDPKSKGTKTKARSADPVADTKVAPVAPSVTKPDLASKTAPPTVKATTPPNVAEAEKFKTDVAIAKTKGEPPPDEPKTNKMNKALDSGNAGMRVASVFQAIYFASIGRWY